MAAAWRTPYDLFDDKRSASAAAAAAAPGLATGKSPVSATPSSVADTVHVRGISIAGWRIETHRGSIADSKTIDTLSESWGIPLPEMPFDKNSLVIVHEQSGWQYVFDGMRALQSVEGVDEAVHRPGVEMGREGMEPDASSSRASGTAGKTRRHGLGEKPKSKRVKVSYANEWGKKRDQQAQQPTAPVSRTEAGPPTSNFGPEVAAAAASGSISTARDFDWTYSCHWPGFETQASSLALQPGTDPARDRIPVERLGPPSTPSAKAEPILFFDDVVLYEDELGDNGSSVLSVKVRVMPTGVLALQRFFLRVDNVVFRVFDTRMYIGFHEEEAKTLQGSDAARAPPFASATRNLLAPTEMPSAPPTRQMSGLSLGTPRRAGGADASAYTNAAIPADQRASLTRPLAARMRVIRECSGTQARYADVKARLPPYKPHDLSPLTDVGWVAQQITRMEKDKELQKQRHQQQHDGASVASIAPLHASTMVSTASQADPTSPAVLPSPVAPGQESHRILGELRCGDPSLVDADRAAEAESWEGEGYRVDVVEIPA